MHKTVKILAQCPAVTSKDVRRAYAITEVQRLKRMQSEGKMGEEQYLIYLKELTNYVEYGDDAPTPRTSGVHPNVNVDAILINYLMGWDEEHSEPEMKRLIGSW